MKTIKAVPITAENFAPYGWIANITDPGGAYGMGEYPSVFHRDMVLVPNASPWGQINAPLTFMTITQVFIPETFTLKEIPLLSKNLVM